MWRNLVEDFPQWCGGDEGNENRAVRKVFKEKIPQEMRKITPRKNVGRDWELKKKLQHLVIRIIILQSICRNLSWFACFFDEMGWMSLFTLITILFFFLLRFYFPSKNIIMKSSSSFVVGLNLFPQLFSSFFIWRCSDSSSGIDWRVAKKNNEESSERKKGEDIKILQT